MEKMTLLLPLNSTTAGLFLFISHSRECRFSIQVFPPLTTRPIPPLYVADSPVSAMQKTTQRNKFLLAAIAGLERNGPPPASYACPVTPSVFFAFYYRRPASRLINIKTAFRHAIYVDSILALFHSS